MRGLLIIIATADRARFRAALTVALAQAALGGVTRVYCHEASVVLLVGDASSDDDSEALAAAGLPDRIALLAMAREAGIGLVACQTGLALAGIGLESLAPGVETGGMVGVLAELGEDRLLSF